MPRGLALPGAHQGPCRLAVHRPADGGQARSRSVHVDLSEWLEPHCHGLKGGIDAGRFVVPFGAFSALSDPSLYRTVSTPLIFNMGQRIFNQDLGFPVLPMPYADEGINLNLSVPVGDCGTGPITVTSDSYLCNG